MARCAACLLLPLLFFASSAGHAYGNGSSFTMSDKAAVDYRQAPNGPVIECAALRSLTDFKLSIVSATGIAATDSVPEHCLVYGLILPEIEFVVQLPAAWNGRLYVHGNGGDAGESVHGVYGKPIRDAALSNGFVATFSNAGHDAAAFPGTRWAYNSPQREIDYSFRALHLNAVAAKQISAAYYGKRPAYSYFDGCSTGGGQGLRAAQRFPGDFDGILAGAPVADPFTLLLYIWNNQNAQELMKFDADRVEILGRIIMDKYDALDGVEDGVIANPAVIDFEPARDLPRDDTGENGFTDTEIEGLILAYRGLYHGGRLLAAGIPVGAELAGQSYEQDSLRAAPDRSPWVNRLVADDGGAIGMRNVMQDWFRYLLLDRDDPALNWQEIKLADLIQRMSAKRPLFSATDPNLHDFRARGGKLLIYNGWADVGVNPQFAIDYYNGIRQVFGSETRDFARLFLIPGMSHCRGGLNVDRFDGMTTLIEWVEKNKAPDRILAHRIENATTTRTRPLCPYPGVATYRGRGDTDQAANFACTIP